MYDDTFCCLFLCTIFFGFYVFLCPCKRMSHENLHHYDLAAGFSFNTYTKLRPKFNIPKSNLSQIFRLFVWVWCRLGKGEQNRTWASTKCLCLLINHSRKNCANVLLIIAIRNQLKSHQERCCKLSHKSISVALLSVSLSNFNRLIACYQQTPFAML